MHIMYYAVSEIDFDKVFILSFFLIIINFGTKEDNTKFGFHTKLQLCVVNQNYLTAIFI